MKQAYGNLTPEERRAVIAEAHIIIGRQLAEIGRLRGESGLLDNLVIEISNEPMPMYQGTAYVRTVTEMSETTRKAETSIEPSFQFRDEQRGRYGVRFGIGLLAATPNEQAAAALFAYATLKNLVDQHSTVISEDGAEGTANAKRIPIKRDTGLPNNIGPKAWTQYFEAFGLRVLLHQAGKDKTVIKGYQPIGEADTMTAKSAVPSDQKKGQFAKDLLAFCQQPENDLRSLGLQHYAIIRLQKAQNATRKVVTLSCSHTEGCSESGRTLQTALKDMIRLNVVCGICGEQYTYTNEKAEKAAKLIASYRDKIRQKELELAQYQQEAADAALAETKAA